MYVLCKNKMILPRLLFELEPTTMEGNLTWSQVPGIADVTGMWNSAIGTWDSPTKVALMSISNMLMRHHMELTIKP